ncbi:putative vegetative cell wall protein gp1-like isoform X3 [Iris pallida]|uniref:Vegetative cell wall protein gp1-like isoform X3 n=1 Tax=Iris pallida TaxID=29817 RepID=A0AAX6FZT7_IRIPA|nr:putative vegetative cell wall protein gp1-like isoform X3 [Iris pallida]
MIVSRRTGSHVPISPSCPTNPDKTHPIPQACVFLPGHPLNLSPKFPRPPCSSRHHRRCRSRHNPGKGRIPTTPLRHQRPLFQSPSNNPTTAWPSPTSGPNPFIPPIVPPPDRLSTPQQKPFPTTVIITISTEIPRPPPITPPPRSSVAPFDSGLQPSPWPTLAETESPKPQSKYTTTTTNRLEIRPSQTPPRLSQLFRTGVAPP